MSVPTGKNAEQLQFSPHGSGESVCEMPTIRPRVFLTGHATLLFFGLFLLPRTPRSTGPGAEQEPVELGRGLGFSALAGVAAIYALMVAIGMAAGTTLGVASLAAIWPALFAGPFFGGVVLLGHQLAQKDREGVSRSVPLGAVDADQGHRRAA